MSKKTKIALSICLFTIVAVVTVGGIFAALSQTFNISNSIKFTGIDRSVNASVSIFVENNGTQTYSYPETTITDGMEIEIDDQTFSFEGVDQAEIDYYINIKNNSTTNNLRVWLNTEPFLGSVQTDPLEREIIYQIDDVPVRDQYKGYLYPNEEYIICLKLILKNECIMSFDFECPFTLETTTEERSNYLAGTDLRLRNYKTEAVVGESIVHPFNQQQSIYYLDMVDVFVPVNRNCYNVVDFTNSNYGLAATKVVYDGFFISDGSPYTVVSYISEGSDDERIFTKTGQATVTSYVLYDTYENWETKVSSDSSFSYGLAGSRWEEYTFDEWYYDETVSISNWLASKGIISDSGEWVFDAEAIGVWASEGENADKYKQQTVHYQKFTYNVTVDDPTLTITLDFLHPSDDTKKTKTIVIDECSICDGKFQFEECAIDALSYNYDIKGGFDLSVSVPDRYVALIFMVYASEINGQLTSCENYLNYLRNGEKLSFKLSRSELDESYGILVGLIREEFLNLDYLNPIVEKFYENSGVNKLLSKYLTFANCVVRGTGIRFNRGTLISEFSLQGVSASDGTITTLDKMNTDYSYAAYKNGELYKYKDGIQVKGISLNKNYLESSNDVVESTYKIFEKGMQNAIKEQDESLGVGSTAQESNIEYYLDGEVVAKKANSNYVEGIPTKIVISKKKAGVTLSAKLKGYDVVIDSNGCIDLSTVVDGTGNTLLEAGQNMFLIEVYEDSVLKECYRLNLYLNIETFMSLYAESASLICLELEEQKAYYLVVDEDDVYELINNTNPNPDADVPYFFGINDNFTFKMFDKNNVEVDGLVINNIYNDYTFEFTYSFGGVNYKYRTKITIVKTTGGGDDINLIYDGWYLPYTNGAFILNQELKYVLNTEDIINDLRLNGLSISTEDLDILEGYLWGINGSDWYNYCNYVYTDRGSSETYTFPILYLPLIIPEENVNAYLANAKYYATGNDDFEDIFKFAYNLNDNIYEIEERIDIYKGEPIRFVTENPFAVVTYPSSIHTKNGHMFLVSMSVDDKDHYYFEGAEGEHDLIFTVTSQTGNTTRTYKIKINYIDEYLDWIDIVANEGDANEEIIEGTFDFENFKFSNATQKRDLEGIKYYFNMAIDGSKVLSAIDAINGTITLSLKGNGFLLCTGEERSITECKNELNDYVFELKSEMINGEEYYYFSFGFVFLQYNYMLEHLAYQTGYMDVYLLEEDFSPLIEISVGSNNFSFFADPFDGIAELFAGEDVDVQDIESSSDFGIAARSYIDLKNFYNIEMSSRDMGDQIGVVALTEVEEPQSSRDIQGYVGFDGSTIFGAYVEAAGFIGVDEYSSYITKSGEKYYLNISLSTNGINYITEDLTVDFGTNIDYKRGIDISEGLESQAIQLEIVPGWLGLDLFADIYFAEVVLIKTIPELYDYPLFFKLGLILTDFDEYLASQAQ